ncbi:MAG TPA: GNAT family N-acetyltransferase, partial [Thermoanaerobaculia bacterium]
MLDLLNLLCHGYVATPIVEALRRHGLFELLETGSFRRRDWLIRKLGASSGYLTVALHALESLGWLERNGDDAWRATARADSGQFDLDLTALYAAEPRALLRDADPARQLAERIEKVLDRGADGLVHGAIVPPLITALQEDGADRFSRTLARVDARLARAIRALFVRQQWLADDGDTLTPAGEHVLQTRVFTIAVSYRPMLHSMEQLLFGDAAGVFLRNEAGEETHVDRRLNVIGSGLQHESYFHDIRQKVVDIFNEEPLEAQPRAVVDVGCGDGSLLAQVHHTIREHTLRGRHLDRLPVRLVGVDYNREALEETARTLADVEHHTLHGDINRPEELRRALERIGVTRDQRVLHIRSFLDHNIHVSARQQADESLAVLAAGQPGAYLDRRGRLLDTLAVLTRWQQHLRDWAQSVGDSDLLILEAHALPADVIQRQLASSENFYFDTIHRLSHQYLIGAEAFLTLAAGVGLFNDAPVKRYPKLAGFCRISMHHLRRRDYVVRHAAAGDLKSLYRLERLCWRKPLRATQRQIRTRLQQYPQGQFVLERDGVVLGAIYSQRIDSIDALKRCHAGNVETLHRPDGPLVQLLAVNVDPAVQNLGYGDQLLEFMLQRCGVMTGVTQIAGVTVCRSYDASGSLPFEEYIRRSGADQDPVLAFHRSHGAAVAEVLPGYRPRDEANRGHGVLVLYDVHARASQSQRAAPAAIAATSDGDVREFVESTTKLLLGAARDAFAFDRPLMEMGLNSADLLALQRQLEQRFQRALKPGFFFEHSTAAKIVAYLTSRPSTAVSIERIAEAAPADIAVIGMSCKLPGGIETPEQLWEVLAAERSVIGSYPAGRGEWPSGAAWAGIDRGGFVHDVDAFDESFFRMSPREAQMTDPQQRILLELAWACLENAAVLPEALKGTSTGVFIGASNADYSRLIQEAGLEIEAHYATGSALAALANRISYFFDLSGPSLLIDTACSSSLVALHAAMRSLRAGECPAALVGGINVICHPHLSIAYRKAGMLAPDGRCKPFDAAANGYVRAEGAVMLLLKPLARALADGDPVHAVLKGSAVNHGGLAAGLTVPNPRKQSELLLAAWKDAGITPQDLSYLEAHGTGTSLGDPIEIEGIQTAYGTSGSCAIGSVKGNLGHLEPAAGIAGLLKVIVALQRRRIPASIHFEKLNPRISLDGPLSIATRSQPWAGERLRLAGVSSFGSGGANAHVVVQEAMERRLPAGRSAGGSPARVIPLSARTGEQLRQRAQDLLRHLRVNEIDLAALAHTLQAGREAMKERVGFVARSVEELTAKLQAFVDGESVADGGSELLDAWTRGAKVDWNPLSGEAPLRRVSLPTYPFARERHWVRKATAAGPARLHPLLHASTSPLLVQSDTAELRGGMRKLLSLPSYPFARERHWTASAPAGPAVLHPLLHTRTSELVAQNAATTAIAPALLTLPTYPFARVRHWIDASAPEAAQPLLFEEYWREEPLHGELPPDDRRTIVFAEGGERPDVRAALKGAMGPLSIVYAWARGKGEAGVHALFELFDAVRESRAHVAQVTLVGHYDTASRESCWDYAWIGFERSLSLLLPDTQISVLYTDRHTPQQLADAARHGGVIRYDGDRRHVLAVRPAPCHPERRARDLGGRGAEPMPDAP